VNIILTIFLLFISGLNGENLLKTDSYDYLKNYNNRPYNKLKYKNKLAKLAKIKKNNLKKIIYNICGEEMINEKLLYRDRLFYIVSTQNYIIRLDATNGSLISKVRIK